MFQKQNHFGFWKDSHHFYPSLPTDPKHDHHAQYCKYALMKFCPWVGQFFNAWDKSADTTNRDVITFWGEFC